MKYDFETVQPRRHVGSKKWDEMEEYGVTEQDDIIPFSVADMEFVQIPEGLEVFRVRNIREAIEFAL